MEKLYDIDGLSYTLEELEELIRRSSCYNNSSAFRQALAFVKEHDIDLYARLLILEYEELSY